MGTLESIIEQAKKDQLPSGFLYLPENYVWELNSLCVIDHIDDPSNLRKLGLTSTFASWFIPELIEKATRIQTPLENETILKAIVYYFEYEVFLPDMEATPPIEENEDEDLIFYDSLGKERPEVNCKNLFCKRGAIKSSVFCRSHHFEMILKKKCIYQH